MQKNPDQAPGLETAYAAICEDSEKLLNYNKQIKHHLEKKEVELASVNKEIQDISSEIEMLTAKKIELDVEIAAQPMSIETVKRIQQETNEIQQETQRTQDSLKLVEDNASELQMTLTYEREKLIKAATEHNRLISEMKTNIADEEGQALLNQSSVKTSVNKQALLSYGSDVKPALKTLLLNITNKNKLLQEKVIKEETCIDRLSVQVKENAIKEGNNSRKLKRLEEEIEETDKNREA